MWIAVLAIRLALALVFIVAGGAKIADPDGAKRSLIGFGLPDRAARFGAVSLPVAEITTGVALMVTPMSWWGAVAALALLVIFLGGISVNMWLGRHPECHCFGKIHSEPAGVSTLVRNGLLAGLAVFLVWQRPDLTTVALPGWVSGLTEAETALGTGAALAIVLLGAAVALQWQILLQQGRLLNRIESIEARLPLASVPPTRPRALAAGLPIGVRAPEFKLSDRRGGSRALDDLLAQSRPLLLVFVNPHCGPCQTLLAELTRSRGTFSNAADVVLISEGSVEENNGKIYAGHEIVLLQQKREVAEKYQAWGTPAAVVIHPNGTIGSPLASGADAIRELAANFRADEEKRQLRNEVVKSIEAAHGIELLDRSNRSILLESFRGKAFVILFWNPSCGFCQAIQSDLKAWDQSLAPRSRLQLVPISSGMELTAFEGSLLSAVLLDREFRLGPIFGANGTPMAVLIDPEGRVASGPVAGGEACLELLRG